MYQLWAEWLTRSDLGIIDYANDIGVFPDGTPVNLQRLKCSQVAKLLAGVNASQRKHRLWK